MRKTLIKIEIVPVKEAEQILKREKLRAKWNQKRELFVVGSSGKTPKRQNTEKPKDLAS